jgi:hypothetical protein
MSKRSFLKCFCLLLGLSGGSVLAADAQSRLDGMATKLAGAEAFSVTIDMTYDVLQASGQQIQFGERREVRVRRPNHLRIDSHQSDGDIVRLIYDGQLLTLFHQNQNVYSQVDHEGNIDSALRFAVGTLGIRTPLARMLVTSLPQEIRKLTQSLMYIERNTLGANPMHHLAGRTKDVDYQVWLADDNLPKRIVITYKDHPGQPQFQADFSDWNMSARLSDGDFAFTPPEGAENIPMLLPKRSSAPMTGGAQ